ncbi:PEP-CTERM sorting domain-containing protein [Verrucomicrobiaceae bacterium R5-34]|uniref:PEP-CTERM sorting domain-containing protein n=1 Tax=Oceaniferula flava TaxID=2800421 RepID=A0AAE2VCR9_9BACT|nr:PEP-CTERM sorting domain-containing protein [Oceaniferula flavus]MBK1830703.1 PEP-CTERM sorting domain-containing protein [Verrucomicrobiaceae bacterium R5-34]MBK1855960.1 PEP-CTERM sorting domain-containing protein [Oceaniferula flavus]MBM1137267.1 PEP-CTERM sorting domain-containing protein [Oceaniferula flavus]
MATNTGIGGGLSQIVAGNGSGGATGLSMTDDGNLTVPSSGHNDRGNFFTTDSYDLTGGFTLTVSYDLLSGAIVSGNASHSMFGLVPSTVAQARNSSVFTGSDTIAFTAVHGSSDTGLSFEGTNVDNSLNVDSTAGFQDIVISVAANGLDYTYSVDGVSQSGTLASAFDFTQEYRFEGYFQDSESYGVYESVTLEVVPEPSSAALLGLGGLALILRRRK